MLLLDSLFFNVSWFEHNMLFWRVRVVNHIIQLEVANQTGLLLRGGLPVRKC